jgi:hypothetical protein
VPNLSKGSQGILRKSWQITKFGIHDVIDTAESSF